MKQQGIPHGNSISPEDILQGLEAHVDAVGLQQAQADFRAMEGILSGLSQWSEVKRLCMELFARKRESERQREQKAELERLRAAAPSIFQMLPTAQMGVSVDGGLRPVSLTQQISGSQVFNGSITNSELNGGGTDYER